MTYSPSQREGVRGWTIQFRPSLCSNTDILYAMGIDQAAASSAILPGRRQSGGRALDPCLPAEFAEICDAARLARLWDRMFVMPECPRFGSETGLEHNRRLAQAMAAATAHLHDHPHVAGRRV